MAAISSAVVLLVGLQLHNYAEVPPEILSQAKEEANAIFRRIDIEVVWSECPLIGSGETSCRDTSARDTPLRAAFKIRILRQSLYREESWKMGVALKEARLANIFYDRVSGFVIRFLENSWRESMTARVLGYAIAHEVSHLLLPVKKVHSPAGIMRGEWSPGDFSNTMRFTDAEVRLMRAALIERNKEF